MLRFALAALFWAATALAECIHDDIMASMDANVPHHERLLHTTAPQEYDIKTDHSGRLLQSTYGSIRIALDLSRLETNA